MLLETSMSGLNTNVHSHNNKLAQRESDMTDDRRKMHALEPRKALLEETMTHVNAIFQSNI